MMHNLSKYLLLTTIAILTLGCEKDSKHDKYFNPNDISKIELESIDDFWENDTILNSSDGMFDNYSGYLDGISHRGEDRGNSISVFETGQMAHDAMESRIADVACVIENGATNEIEGEWWFGDCIPNIVFVKQWNTIIEVYYYESDFESIENLLYTTANEIARRVDNLSK